MAQRPKLGVEVGSEKTIKNPRKVGFTTSKNGVNNDDTPKNPSKIHWLISTYHHEKLYENMAKKQWSVKSPYFEGPKPILVKTSGKAGAFSLENLAGAASEDGGKSIP